MNELPIDEAIEESDGKLLGKSLELALSKKKKNIDNRKGKSYGYKEYKPPIIHEIIIPTIEEIKKEVSHPKKINNEIVNRLLWAFAHDYNDVEACLYSGVSKPTLYKYYKENPHIFTIVENIKNTPSMIAKTNIVDSLLRGNIEDSKWWLSKKNRLEFGEPEAIPAGTTIMQQLEQTIKTELSETVTNSKTIAFINSKKKEING
jgi:hypothetical protein